MHCGFVFIQAQALQQMGSVTISKLLTYIGLSIVYSALAFKDELPRKEARIFSRKNTRTLQNILLIHLEFLMILWGLIWLYPVYERILPDWLTDDTFLPSRNWRQSYSILECSVPFVMIGIAYIERRLIYAECKTDGSGGGNDPDV
jgi:hypothetical protein